MQITDLIARLNNLTDKEEVVIYFKALRQDALIWEGIKQILDNHQMSESLTRLGQELNPGTLAVLISDPDFDFTTLTSTKVSREALEKMMFGYENYLQSGSPVDSLERAGLLALALIEKRKSVPNWVSIFQDLTSRMKITDAEKFQQCWGTIMVIALNLIESKEEFLRDLMIFQQPENSIDVLNHLVSCLPKSEEEKAELLRRNLYPLSPQVQILALKKLKMKAGSALTSGVAERILEKYPSVGNTQKSTRDHWRNPVSSMHFAFQCQAAADIAQLAGKNQLARDLNEKSLEVFSALVKMGKVKQAGILLESDPSSEMNKLFSNDELSDPEILSELVYTSGNMEIPSESEKFSARIIRQAKSMSQAGNADLAREELRENLNQLSDVDFEQILVNGPEQIQGWEPGEFLNMLVETGAFEEADRLAALLLVQNPTSVPVNKAAALAAEGRQDYQSALSKLETLAALEPESKEIKRKLAKAYLETGSDEVAFSIYQDLTRETDNAEDKDLINFGEIALKINKPQETLNAAAVVLARNPENAKGLTLSGIAHHKTGQGETAIEELKKAIAVSDGESRPWIELGEIIWSDGDHASALTTFKEGIAANPGNFDLQRVYAQKMMDEGLISEAYPYLLDLSNKNKDREIDLLLVEAMKHLGNENIEEALEQFMERYPNDYRFKGEYGVKLVWGDRIEKGLVFLRQVEKYLPANSAWSLAYVEGLLRPDYKPLAPGDKSNTVDRRFTKELLDDILVKEPDNLRAKLLKAEWLLQSNDFRAARELFDAIMDESQGGRELPLARLYTGLAQSAVQTNDQEIALAALEQAIGIEPDWFGLQRIKAEFYLLVDEKERALKQVLSALEMTMEVPENYIWAVNFMTGTNEPLKAGKLISEAIEKFPDHLGLRLIQAQNLLPSASDEESHEIEQKILSLISNTENPVDLVKAAVVFANFDNLEKTIDCLEIAAANGSFEAKLFLAGLYRIRKEHENALKVLDTIQPVEAFIDLLKAEIEFDHTGQISEEGYRIDGLVDLPSVKFEDVFLPGAWKELLNTSKPDIVLQTRIVMANGQPGELMDRVCDWINTEPDNLEARVFGVELSLACSANEDYKRFMNYEVGGESSSYLNHFKLLKMEYLLDTDTFVQDDPLQTEIYETMRVDEPQKIALIRVLAADGNLHEAETTFEMAMSIFSDMVEQPYIVRLGILRNLVKCASSLDRWSEVVNLSSEAARIAPRNDALQLLMVKSLTIAAEMNNRVEGLGVEKHCTKEELAGLSINQEELPENVTENCREEMKHWILRYKLAVDPTRENIRALALLTPLAEDAAALMAGLRSIGQVNTAIQVAKKFAEHPKVLFELARCSAAKDPARAVEILEKSLLVYPNQPLALRLRTSYLEQLGRSSEAVENLEEALSYWPNEYIWHEEAADLWKRLGNMEKPVEHLQLAVLYTPGNSSVHQKLGDALLKTNKPGEALKHLLKAVEMQPDQHELWEAISEAHQQTGDLNLAMEAAEKAVQVDPFAVKARLQAGKVRWTRGELEKALDQVNLAISLDPEDADNFVFMARLLIEQGDKRKALEMLDKAAQSKNATVHTMIEHASLLTDIKGPAAARDLIASFSEKYPENPGLLKLLAEAEEQCGNIKKAELVAKKALEIHPGETSLQMLLGKIQAKVGNLDQAVHYFSQAVALEPKMIEGYLNLSQTYINQRDYVKARKVLEQGIEKLPDEISLYLACASLLKEAKDYQGAEKMLRKASLLEPRNVNIHRQLGAVLALNLVHQSQEVSSQP